MISMKMSEGGRVVVPIEIRRALAIADGDTVLWELVDGAARLTTQLQRLRKAQDIVARSIPPQTSLVNELIAERRVESAGE